MTKGLSGCNFALIFSKMAKKLHLRIPIFSTRATATLSVALVLVILGLAAMVGIVTGRVTESVKENMGFVVVLAEDV